MYSIDKTRYGFKLVLSGVIKSDEMKAWVEDIKKALRHVTMGFSVFVDMRELGVLNKESQEWMQVGQKYCKSKGLVRSVVILSSAIMQMQFTRIAKETGIYEWERYIDSAAVKNWQEVGEAWLVDAKDPDK